MNTVTRSILIWFYFLVLAFVNGAFREIILINFFGISQHLAQQISCLTGVTMWTLLLQMNWPRLKVKTFTTASLMGLGWFVATMLFETFILNRNLSWSEIRHTYDVSAGEYWGLVLLWIGLMPIGFYGLEKLRQTPH